jgi:FlaA1/EpsC-like NDP-sugar epimerase
MLEKQRPWAIFMLELILIVLSGTVAWLLRFDFTFPQPTLFLRALPLLLLLRIAAMARFHLFHGYWRYSGISDALDVVKAVTLGSLAFLLVERWILRQTSLPISFYFLEAMLTALALGGIRILSRVWIQRSEQRAKWQTAKSVVVVGAGCGAAMLLRELPRSGYRAVALVDDDPAKASVALNGIRVAGSIAGLPVVVDRYHPDEIMIAIPSATSEQMRRITEVCHRTGVRFRTVPGLADLIHGTVTVDQMREVNLQDLLGRDPVQLNLESVKCQIAGRVIMVTGAAGSIGSELCRQLLSYGPAKLVCVDQAETPLFYLQHATSDSKVKKAYCVADITDRARMQEILGQHHVHAIFHAAAYKHVPLMEQNLQEAVKNNVFGLLSLMEVACQCDCEDFPAYFLRQGSNSNQLHGVHQADRGTDCGRPAFRPDAMRFCTVRQRAWLSGKCDSTVPGANPIETPDYGDASRHHSLLYDHTGGRVAALASVCHRQQWRHSSSRYGRAGQDPGHGEDAGPTIRHSTGRSGDRIHRLASGRKAVRRAFL